MFAFALWDEKRRSLLLARDRMGEKPLYIYQTGEKLLFSSELKSLMGSGDVKFRLDPVAIDQYFHYGYVPEPLTPVEGVRKLQAGYYLRLRLDVGEIEEKCYWRMEDGTPMDGNPTDRVRTDVIKISG